MKDKILNWINENCFTDKALIAVNVWEIVFYLYHIRLYFDGIRRINEMDANGLLSLIHISPPFSEIAIVAFIILIVVSILSIYKKWNYWTWILKISSYFSLIFFLSNLEGGLYYIVLWLLIIYHLHWKSFEKFVGKERENWSTFFYVIGLIAVYVGLWFGFHNWFY